MQRRQWRKNGKIGKDTGVAPDESQKQKEVVEEARNKDRIVHFASLRNLVLKYQKYKDRDVLRGDIVKDDSGSYAIFTEQGSSASQMTVAKIMDIIPRLQGCAGQAPDAVSAYFQVKMEDAPTLLKIQKSECPDHWIRLPKHKWPKPWSSMEDTIVPLERNLYGHPLAVLLWERQFEKVLLKHLSVYVDDIKLTGKKQNISPTWKIIMKDVDVGEPRSFLDHVYLDCTQRECQISKEIVENYRNIFVSRISVGARQKQYSTGKLEANISSLSYDMEGHAKKYAERYCELTNKTTQQLYKVVTSCFDDHQF